MRHCQSKVILRLVDGAEELPCMLVRGHSALHQYRLRVGGIGNYIPLVVKWGGPQDIKVDLSDVLERWFARRRAAGAKAAKDAKA